MWKSTQQADGVTWLNEAEWRHVQGVVPIACVDVVPLQLNRDRIDKVGLILRDTPHQGQRWCVVGGRLLRNESFTEAIRRQLHETLGDAIEIEIPSDPQPSFVAQYFTIPSNEGNFDPRQHAVGLTFCVPIGGALIPQGEAISFKWFDPGVLPAEVDFGFGQHSVVQECLRRLGLSLKT